MKSAVCSVGGGGSRGDFKKRSGETGASKTWLGVWKNSFRKLNKGGTV